jgi:hypothetical protein
LLDKERDEIFGEWLAAHKWILFKVVACPCLCACRPRARTSSEKSYERHDPTLLVNPKALSYFERCGTAVAGVNTANGMAAAIAW